MTISTTDLKIQKSQRMRDTADGGGAMSPDEVIDGEINNVFDDISTEDRVSGRVSIRKVFPGVFSDNTDRFFGAGVLIIEPAADPAVDVLMTRREFYDDERENIVERIQSYLAAGATQPWRLWNDHLTGTASLTLYAVPGSRGPDLGDTWFLEDTDGIQASEAVKIQSVISRDEQTFVDENNNTFQRDVLVVELSRPLQADWEGTEVQRRTVSTPPTRLRGSTPSAGARYYSTKKLLEDITQGDLTIQVDNPYRRIVPTTSAEQPITDERATLSGVSYKRIGEADAISVSASQSYSAGETKSWFVGGTILPGSIAISGTITATDPGTGTLDIVGSGTAAEVDYETGEISITRNSSGSLSLNITATPAAAVQDSTLTVQIPITPQTRQLNYVRTLRPLPAPGTVSVDYRSLGNWYRLTDNGAGSLSGDTSGQGGGSVNYGSGTVTATLAALPDVGTVVIISWGNPVIVSDESGKEQPSPPQIRFTVANGPIKPGTLEITYDSDGSTITHTTDADGYVIDAATDQIGRYVPHTGEVAFIPKTSEWPDSDTNIGYTFDRSDAQQEGFQPTPSGGSDTVSFTLATAPEPGSVKLKWPVEAEVYGRVRIFEVDILDDGQGGFIYPDGQAVTGATINYGTGDVSMPAAYEVTT